MQRPVAVLLTVIAVASALLVTPTPCKAWSIESHQIVARQATEFLPSSWRELFRYYSWLINETAVYPDTYYRESDPEENPRHFIDLEVWSPNNPWTGTLPQSVEQFALEMRSAIETRRWNDMFLHAGRIAHYMADAAQPYHTTVNYNPRNQKGVGLHQVLDSSLAAHYSEFLLRSEPIQLLPIDNITRFALDVAIQSHSFLPAINRTLIDEGLDWSPELTEIIENRTNTAIMAVARVWYTVISHANGTAPRVPQPNTLAIAIGNISLNFELVTIRISISDALGIKSYANILLRTGNSTFRGNIANVVPPIGEYVIVLPSAEYSPPVVITADRENYQTAKVMVNASISRETTSGQMPIPESKPVEIPETSLIALLVVAVALVGLLVVRRAARDS